MPARKKTVAATEAPTAETPTPPDLRVVDVAFDNIDHMPEFATLPEAFQRGHYGAEPHCAFIDHWFFCGRTAEDIARLVAKPGVDRLKAIRAIGAIMRSFEPKHEHKIAACGYLLSQWFDLAPTTPVNAATGDDK